MRQHLRYVSARPGPAGTGPLLLTRLQLLDRLAALVPPPRINRHRHFAVLVRTAAQGKFPRRCRTTGGGRMQSLAPALQST